MKRLLNLALGAFALAAPLFALGQNDPCPLRPAGGQVVAPDDLWSQNGVLRVSFSYQTGFAPNGSRRFCFVTPNGLVEPTLHVRPGDELIINLVNKVPPPNGQMDSMPGMAITGTPCGTAAAMDSSSVNIHYHGTNVAPTCHEDEVINTLVNSGQSFQYDVHFPADEPPGLYWYHPHVHGQSEKAVQGGATGAIVVEGIQNVNPAVAGLPSRVLIIRDNPPAITFPESPTWDLSLNYTPITYPHYQVPSITMQPGAKEFWRVLNSSADTILDIQLSYDGQVQPLGIVGLDGVPTGSQDGTHQGKIITQTHILLPPAARAEFIVTGPSVSVQNATLATLAVETGPAGDYDPTRPLATIQASAQASRPALIPAVSGPPPAARFQGLASATPSAQRTLYFSELFIDDKVPSTVRPLDDDAIAFYITVAGQVPTVYDPANPPAIVTTQGAVEDWTIQNRSTETHDFHIHQIHFLVLEQNGKPVSNGQYLDTVTIPYWTGTGPYPSVKVRMDFRGPVTGDFVYHCHLLEHEDGGMMAIIRVLPYKSDAAK